MNVRSAVLRDGGDAAVVRNGFLRDGGDAVVVRSSFRVTVVMLWPLEMVFCVTVVIRRLSKALF